MPGVHSSEEEVQAPVAPTAAADEVPQADTNEAQVKHKTASSSKSALRVLLVELFVFLPIVAAVLFGAVFFPGTYDPHDAFPFVLEALAVYLIGRLGFAVLQTIATSAVKQPIVRVLGPLVFIAGFYAIAYVWQPGIKFLTTPVKEHVNIQAAHIVRMVFVELKKRVNKGFAYGTLILGVSLASYVAYFLVMYPIARGVRAIRQCYNR